jgi:threonine synthase
MGLPVDILIASNTNYVLFEFFAMTFGQYRVRPAKEIVATSSPSMDIGEASNFERLMFEALGRNAARIRELWSQIKEKGEFGLTILEFRQVEKLNIRAGMASERDMAQAMRTIYKLEDRPIIDPHTAVAMSVALERRDPKVKMLVAETAQPWKFPEAVKAAIGVAPPTPESVQKLWERQEKFYPLEANAEALKAYILKRAA